MIAWQGRAGQGPARLEHHRVLKLTCSLHSPNTRRPQVMKATAGRVLEDTLSEVLLAGVRPLAPAELDRVDAAIKELRMDREVAKQVFAEVRRSEPRRRRALFGGRGAGWRQLAG
jgi:hypothetical protein